MSSDDDIRNAIKAIDAKKKAIKSTRASIVRGGATGMVQQSNLKSYPKRIPMDDHIYPGIKNSIKKNYPNIDLVFMHGLGTRYFVANEDAKYIHQKYEKPYRDDVKSYSLTSISQKKKSECIKDLIAENKGYAFLDMIQGTDPILRRVIDSSDASIIGKKY
jgi:hypothetical protein